ncbi:hypothetical protein ACH42_03295 [Endozoicomonas sp. (ex Bugula neritina AB1)]|nr:hypothetical protein ACH42_03295 [Endozoicomonas sp. (ex Bugula neritina AB1)]
MQLLLCEGFSVDPDGMTSCSGETATITLEEVRDIPVPNGLTLEQADALIGATLVAIVTAFIFALVLRQLR